MIQDRGPAGVDCDPLRRALLAIPIAAWRPRADPESDTTLALRESMSAFPRHAVAAVLDPLTSRLWGPGHYNRVVLSNVPAGCRILPHTDDFGPEAHARSVHCHLPLLTHPAAVLCGDAGCTHLRRDRVYVLDARARHWVDNPSDQDRVHLLFAYFPDAWAGRA